MPGMILRLRLVGLGVTLLVPPACADKDSDDDTASTESSESNDTGQDGTEDTRNSADGSDEATGRTSGAADGAEKVGCANPDNWSIAGDGNICQGSCNDHLGITCSDRFPSPECRLTSSSGLLHTCSFPSSGQGADLCRNAIDTSCASYW